MENIMDSLFNNLKKYFDTTSQDKVLEDWEKTKEFDKIGPTIDEFICKTINDYSLNQIVEDLDNRKCIITGKTKTSIEVFIERKNKKGVDCSQWFDFKKFEERFKAFGNCENLKDIKVKNYIFYRDNLGVTLKCEDFDKFLYFSMFKEKEKKSVNESAKKIEVNLLNHLTTLTNRSKAQTQELFELCDFDFLKLLELERKIKSNFIFWCPGDHDAVNLIMTMNDISNRFKLDFLMCQPKCVSKEYPSLYGFLSKKLEANPGKWENQLGIYWKNTSEFLKLGLPVFWQDESKIDIIITE